ncbi:hypothetical protein [Vreelandella alkaliphila]|uniref:Uncharacterized protein n=1 Tax=Vreelandella alkaliphila TaxID=272774 RepID=A0AAJ2VSG9_9GAMM|nr:hypothetical protein [Halomonas alkaliphila]MDX5979634.1 hypothetical protein [Halomonas alkaliphila]
MALLRDTLTGIISAFNRAHLLRELSLTVASFNGKAEFRLADHLPAGAHSVVVSSVSVSNDNADLRWHIASGYLHASLSSKGRHYSPQPWDALARPVTLSVVAAYVPPPLDVPDLDLDGLHHFGVSLPAELEHVVNHGMGKTRFIERITDNEGRAQFASVEALDANHVRVTLVEALPVRLDMIFMPDNAGLGAS